MSKNLFIVICLIMLSVACGGHEAGQATNQAAAAEGELVAVAEVPEEPKAEPTATAEVMGVMPAYDTNCMPGWDGASVHPRQAGNLYYVDLVKWAATKEFGPSDYDICYRRGSGWVFVKEDVPISKSAYDELMQGRKFVVPGDFAPNAVLAITQQYVGAFISIESLDAAIADYEEAEAAEPGKFGAFGNYLVVQRTDMIASLEPLAVDLVDFRVCVGLDGCVFEDLGLED